jgi:hypothetical protein
MVGNSVKFLILCILFSTSLFSDVSITKVRYEGGISLFGKVAIADIVLKEDLDKKTYKMEVSASSIGLVKALTSNRKDVFISEGKIQTDKYIPYKFTKISTEDGYEKRTIYSFDYEKQKVLKEVFKEELVVKNSFDIINMKTTTEEKFVKSNSSEYIDLKDNDYISMFLNLSADKLKEGQVCYIDQKESDDVMLISKTMFEVSKDHGDELYRISFSKDNGMFFDKAVAIDIAFYGDAYLQKVYENKEYLKL